MDISNHKEVQRLVHGLGDGHAGKGGLAEGRRRPWDTRRNLPGTVWEREHVGFKHCTIDVSGAAFSLTNLIGEEIPFSDIYKFKFKSRTMTVQR